MVASRRYRKLLNRQCTVFKLETSEGALLCGDDFVCDVVDDKEILIAVYDDEDETMDVQKSPMKPPYAHPRLAGDASLGLSPIHTHPHTQR